MELNYFLDFGEYLRKNLSWHKSHRKMQLHCRFHFSKYNGDFNPLLGLLHMKVGKIQLFKNSSRDALHNLNRASDILKITHGEDHNLYRNELVPLLIQAASECEPDSD